MSLGYLSEYAEAARTSLALAEREAAHLHYTWRTLYAQPIDRTWVESLETREDLAEKIDAFVGRFGRLQDHLGEKVLPAFVRLLGGQPKSLLDVLDFAERMEWVPSAVNFIGARKLRNLLVHEYMTDPDLFLEALITAKPATEMLLGVVRRIKEEAVQRQLLSAR